MTQSIDSSYFSFISNINPGGGLSYYTYLAAVADSYDVSISQAGGFDYIENYYVFSLQNPALVFDDTVSVGMPGTYATGSGDDLLLNNEGTENTYGFPQPLRFFGGGGDDTVNDPSQVFDSSDMYVTDAYGGSGNDALWGGSSNDVLFGDTADGFTGDPVIGAVTLAAYDTANDGSDTISGLGGNDSLSGDGGDDQLFGGDGADTVQGGDGDDFLFGGPRGTGNLDLLTGGAGSDAFMLSYAGETANGGSGFWSSYFKKVAADIAGNEAKVLIQNAIRDGIAGLGGTLLAAGLGQAASDLAVQLVTLIESLIPSNQPAVAQDVMVIEDFDPREDVVILPLSTTEALTMDTVDAATIPGGGSGTVLAFKAGNTVYAYLKLSDDFILDMGIAPTGADIAGILTNLFNISTGLVVPESGQVGFANLIDASITQNLPDGGFQPVSATLPTNSQVAIYGAVGGLVVDNHGGVLTGSKLAGTNYVDALSTNGFLGLPGATDTLSSAAAKIHGFGGDDLIYGTAAADELFGDDGDDVLYSFVTTSTSNGFLAEALSGGDGNDTLYGGGSAGDFDGGAGIDTFGVAYTSAADALRISIDLVAGSAVEYPPGPGGSPGGAASTPGAGSNSYTLTGIENAIGGPLNDSIIGAPGSVIEGGPGGDFLDARAGGVIVSYDSSPEGVSVLLYTTASQANGGDAGDSVTGYDVIAYTDVSNVAGLVGSAFDDTLGAYNEDGDIAFTGNGGSDVFRILGYTFNGNDLPFYHITDFTRNGIEDDVIDLRPFGTTSMNELVIVDNEIGVLPEPGATVIDFYVVLDGYAGPIDTSAFLFASAATGAASTGRAGGGLVGDAGMDSFVGAGGQDYLLGRGADDALLGRHGGDGLDGGVGDDSLSGGADGDHLTGGDGSDALRGGSGDDILLGGNGADLLTGRDGNDVLDGGAGADNLRGGAGADLFLLRLGELDGDRILDYDRDQGDALRLVTDGPISITESGDGRFLLTDGTVSELIRVQGAVVADFLL